MTLIGFQRGCVEVLCLRLLSSLKQLTRNRLKPVQTGRFHLGLVFSRWRRVKFGPVLRPHRAAIGCGLGERFLVGVPLAEKAVRLFQFAQAPTRLLRPERKRGQTDSHAEWTPSWLRLSEWRITSATSVLLLLLRLHSHITSLPVDATQRYYTCVKCEEWKCSHRRLWSTYDSVCPSLNVIHRQWLSVAGSPLAWVTWQTASTIHLPVACTLVIFHQPRVGVVTRSWTHGVRKTTWRRMLFRDRATVAKSMVEWVLNTRCQQQHGRDVWSRRVRSADWEPSSGDHRCQLRMQTWQRPPPLPPSSPLWSRGPARYLMEKYWIWCVVETVHSPGKSFTEDFSKGVWVPTQQHCPPLISTCLFHPHNMHRSFKILCCIWSKLGVHNICFWSACWMWIGLKMSFNPENILTAAKAAIIWAVLFQDCTSGHNDNNFIYKAPFKTEVQRWLI